MKRINIFLCLVLFTIATANAQIATGEMPISWETDLAIKRNSRNKKVPAVLLPAINYRQLLKEDANDNSGRLRVAKVLAVDYSTENSGIWQTLKNGDKLWRLSIQAKEAKALGLVFDHFELAPGEKVFVYSANRKDVIGALTHTNNKTFRKLAVRPVEGDEMVVEYYVPKKVKHKGTIKIGELTYHYKDLRKTIEKANSRSASPEDINCHDDWQRDKRAVTHISYTESGSGWICSGALINNTAEDGTPYFLTANHCIGTNAVANTAVFYFNYEFYNCNGSESDKFGNTISGAQLRATHQRTDFSLLELSNRPPERFNAYYAGWSRSDSNPSEGTCIHHPGGREKEYAHDNDEIKKKGSSISWTDGTQSPANSHWAVKYEVGDTPGGSSGSPLFNQNKKIVGQLHGGNPTEYFGRFDLSWTGGGTANTRLSNWLDPIGLDRTTSRGMEANECITFALNNFGYSAGEWRMEKHPRMMADVNGDGKDDIVGFGYAGVYVSYSTGSGFTAPQRKLNHFGYSAGGWRVDKHPRMMADVNGDGKADIVGFANSGVYVSFSTGNGFTAPQQKVANFGHNAGGWRIEKHPRMMADVNGDDRADIVGFANAGVYVSYSTGNGFTAPQRKVANFGHNAGGWRVENHPRMMADANGDGKDDIIGFANAGVYVSYSTGNGFTAPQRKVASFGFNAGGWRVENHPRMMADVNGDGKADIVGFGNAGVYVSYSTGNSFTSPQLKVSNTFGFRTRDIATLVFPFALDYGWKKDKHPRTVVDVNGDGKADIVGFSNDGVKIAYSLGNNFTAPKDNIMGFDYSNWQVSKHPRLLADTDGDGANEVVGFGYAGVYIGELNDCYRFDICDANKNFTNTAWIHRVSDGTTRFTTGRDEGYGDYKHLTFEFTKGRTNQITITSGFSGNRTWQGYAVWIDFNKDGIFNNAEERVVFKHAGPDPLTQIIAIPANAVLGKTIMRVSASSGGYGNKPCQTRMAVGEREDYSVNIVQAISTSATLDTNIAESRSKVATEKEAITQLETPSLLIAPNPFKNQTTISLEIPKDGSFQIGIFDATGRLVHQVEEHYTKGLHKINFNPTNDLGEGMYFVRLIGENVNLSQKMIRIR